MPAFLDLTLAALQQGIVPVPRAVWGFRADDVHLVVSPLFHSGPHRFALNSLVYGARVVVLDGFDAGAVLAAIERERVTTTFMVPTHRQRLLDHPDLDRTDLAAHLTS